MEKLEVMDSNVWSYHNMYPGTKGLAKINMEP
jgi:hypothetical protein